MGLLDDYGRQAIGYDETRGAGDAVLRPLTSALASARGPHIVDIGGGTGNYALALARLGFRPTVVDRSPAMLEHAADKGLACVEADATSLPFPDEHFDGAILISMLHHVDRPTVALAEAKRVTSRSGPVIVMAFTREDAESLWVLDYFPSSRAWMAETHMSSASLMEELPGAEVERLVLADPRDVSLAALCGRPDLMLEPRHRRQTSYFERMERDHPEELAAGLRRLQQELDEGRAPATAGTATFLVAQLDAARAA